MRPPIGEAAALDTQQCSHGAGHILDAERRTVRIAEIELCQIAVQMVLGAVLPERLVPDISNGLMFCAWLRKNGVDTDALPKYWHIYEDGRRVQAKAYPESLLAEWRKHFREEWLPLRATEYFRQKDSAALPYLPLLLPKPGDKAA